MYYNIMAHVSIRMIKTFKTFKNIYVRFININNIASIIRLKCRDYAISGSVKI